MANDVPTIDGVPLDLHPVSLVSFEDGCSDSPAFVPGHHDAGDTVPCPGCAGEHRIERSLQTEEVTNIEIRTVEPEEDEPGQ
ncbi:hypothetical protein [Pseudonocardia sp. KRD291]|uniref:hypothetical protein n=1 Tax=Pseudonocardia sp. KRD291 TaxID=2792007 RepID=UPI001C49FFC3|nr:hypothetical protein [Pseudonocardia sp. KRD291]MBW0101522.1 hypothetical protein [Pseudonocardia sp. KRD291]